MLFVLVEMLSLSGVSRCTRALWRSCCELGLVVAEAGESRRPRFDPHLGLVLTRLPPLLSATALTVVSTAEGVLAAMGVEICNDNAVRL